MKKILGLDLGTNSIGWAVVETSQTENGEEVFSRISSAGSRIIPMDQATIGDFNKGNSKSQTAERTRLRGIRRLYERANLRRERLNRVLSIMGWLPEHYQKSLDEYGKLLPGTEPKIAWRRDSSGKWDFLFQDAFNEMLSEFKMQSTDFVFEGHKIPYDWTVYYLRKKALSHPVSKYELAWILHSFNQKRGYYQLRGEDEKDAAGKLEEYYSLMVTSVEDTGEKKGSDTWYNVKLENGFVYRRAMKEAPEWIGKVKDFIVTTDVDKNGNPKVDKDGNVKRSFRMPKEDDWALQKKKTEHDIEQSGKTVGEFIYDALLAASKNPSGPTVKIRGKLVRVVERKYYRTELERILKAQIEFNPDLCNRELYQECISALYPNNTAYRNSISGSDFKYLFVKDILFYQRPLKSKKSLISDCPMEERYYIDNVTGKKKIAHIKCIAKSNPYFQEFRLWQFVLSLRIYERERLVDGALKVNVDVTSDFIHGKDALADLFEWINDKKSIDQKTFLSYPGFKLRKAEQEKYRWNFMEEKSYPANETRAGLLEALSKAGVDVAFLSKNKEYELWNILYSIDDKAGVESALQSFVDRNNLPDGFVAAFSKVLPYKKDYGSYSEKAIKKMLALMRVGKFWSEDQIDSSTQERISKLLSGEFDESIRDRVREKTISLQSIHDFQGLPVWLACYVVYNRHSEAKEIEKWESPEDIDLYLKKFKQHSLRNPIVESVIMETLRTVRDIWKAEGRIDEVHVELGKEMKNPAEKRKQITDRVIENENANLRIRAMLTEFLNPEFDVDNVRPNSPGQQEILRLYEDSVLENTEMPDDIKSILNKFNQADPPKRPTTSEVLRYKAWLEQKYRSPYTGEIIPLGKLFTPAYEIEHIIPQSLYFDDSFSNKVICESEVNKLKDNSLGYQFIKEHQGEIVTLSGGRQVKILTVEAYEKFVKDNYGSRKNAQKKRNLLADEIPESFIQRQLNDSRYISKVVKTLLSNVVREKNEEQDISKNVITCTGGVTDRLKKDWGVKNVWNRIVMPRFERLDKMIPGEQYVVVNANGQHVPTVPFSRSRGFNIKRIDHRHHAMDAIVIACATRNIVNYLNNESACRNAEIKRFDLQRIVCEKVHQDDSGNYKWVVKKPSASFASEVKDVLDDCIVSFKQNLRIINKSSNWTEKINEEGKKVYVRQTKGENWAIRKSMHKDTVFGEVDLRKVKSVSLNEALKCPERIVRKDIKKLVSECESANAKKKAAVILERFPEATKLDIYYYTLETKDRYFATRIPITQDFIKEFIEKSVTDAGIREILLAHLAKYGGKAEIAFSADGIEDMNAHIKELNGGASHKPIYKVRKYEKAEKFAIGETGCKTKKFVEADKGTNLFFGIYLAPDGKRTYASIPLIESINREKDGLGPVPEKNGDGELMFYLSPNDLVYVPTEDEIERGYVDEKMDKSRIYKMVSANKGQCFFIDANVSTSIVDKVEFSSSNKMERAITGEMIKSVCIPIKVDRLGRIVNFNGKLR